MKVIVTPRAEADIESQHSWGVDRFGKDVADRTFAKVRRFIEVRLSRPQGPRRQLPLPNVFESWIPNTPFVLFYRIDTEADTVHVLALFRHSQGRSVSDLDDNA